MYHAFPSFFSGGGRLRIEDDTAGIGPPLHENQTVTQAGITSGQTVIVEPGPAPLSSQVAIFLAAKTQKIIMASYFFLLIIVHMGKTR